MALTMNCGLIRSGRSANTHSPPKAVVTVGAVDRRPLEGFSRRSGLNDKRTGGLAVRSLFGAGNIAVRRKKIPVIGEKDP